MKARFHKPISVFENYFTPGNPKPIALIKWLQAEKYRGRVEQIRLAETKAERDSLKATLPACTPSGLFKYRDGDPKNFVQHTGFIQFDIDAKGNERIGNYSDLKRHICNIEEVAYCGLSVSGKGYWGLIPIEEPERHTAHFWALCQAFQQLGITIDIKPRYRYSLRGYSWDPEPYFNFDAKVFTDTADDPREAKPKATNTKPRHYKTHRNGNDTRDDVEALINTIQARRVDITNDFNDWLKLGYAFANEFGEAGRDYFHAVSQYYSGYTERETDKIYTACSRSGGSTGNAAKIETFFYLTKQYGITLYSANTNQAPRRDKPVETKSEAPIFGEPGTPADCNEIEAKNADPQSHLAQLREKDEVLNTACNLFELEPMHP